MSMAVSRLLRAGSLSFFIRLHRNASSPLHSYAPPLFGSYPPPLRLRSISSLLRPLSQPATARVQFYCSGSATAVIDDAESSPSSPPHPWPEWELFLEKLKRKGYFDKSNSDEAVDDTESSTASATFTGLNRVKFACLSFARERFDLLRCLPKEDIQAVVECGCPNLFRKAINSAKRLRSYLRLDEGDVCSACNLRGSCDRAYVIAKEDEGARTVDIVRILMCYAADPLVLSMGEKPQVKEQVQGSVRRLISELLKLSDTTPAPGLPKPAEKPPRKKEQPSNVLGMDNKQFQNVEMKRGDWICSKCNFMNFSRNVRCLECKEDGPKRVNFEDMEMKKGDWSCPECQFMNFSRNQKCLRCQGLRPERQLNPGEWECPSCNFLNFRKNMVCLKCNCDRPRDAESSQLTPYEDQMWKKPKMTPQKNLIDFEDTDDLDIDDILPFRGDNKFVVNKRASPADRKFTSARNRNYPQKNQSEESIFD